jgi:hypothetical protein
LLFNTDLKGWTEQLAMAEADSTKLVTVDVATNSVGKDSGFYQNGLPTLLDADSDGFITLAELTVGKTAAYPAYVDYLLNLDDN